MPKLFINEVSINATEHYSNGETGVHETRFESIGELYKSLVREFGRCISKMYNEDKDGNSKVIGWVFQKRMKYDDYKDTFLSETWVSVHDDLPVKSIKYDYHSFA